MLGPTSEGLYLRNLTFHPLAFPSLLAVLIVSLSLLGGAQADNYVFISTSSVVQWNGDCSASSNCTLTEPCSLPADASTITLNPSTTASNCRIYFVSELETQVAIQWVVNASATWTFENPFRIFLLNSFNAAMVIDSHIPIEVISYNNAIVSGSWTFHYMGAEWEQGNADTAVTFNGVDMRNTAIIIENNPPSTKRSHSIAHQVSVQAKEADLKSHHTWTRSTASIITPASLTFVNCSYVTDESYGVGFGLIKLTDATLGAIPVFFRIVDTLLTVDSYNASFIELMATGFNFVTESTRPMAMSSVEVNRFVNRTQTANNASLAFSFQTELELTSKSLVHPTESTNRPTISVVVANTRFAAVMPSLSNRRRIHSPLQGLRRELSDGYALPIYSSLSVSSAFGRRRSQNGEMEETEKIGMAMAKKEVMLISAPLISVFASSATISGLDLTSVDTLLLQDSTIINCQAGFSIRNTTIVGDSIISFSPDTQPLDESLISYSLTNAAFNFANGASLEMSDAHYRAFGAIGGNTSFAPLSPTSLCHLSISYAQLIDASIIFGCNTTILSLDNQAPESLANVFGASSEPSITHTLTLHANGSYNGTFHLETFGVLDVVLGRAPSSNQIASSFAGSAFFHGRPASGIHIEWDSGYLGAPTETEDVTYMLFLLYNTPSFELIQPSVIFPSDRYGFMVNYSAVNGTHSRASFRLDSALPIPSSAPSPVAKGCDQSIPGFVCQDGVLISNHSITFGSNVTLTIGTSPVIVGGNLTVGSLVFTNPGTTLTIEGCLNFTHGTVVIDLTQKTSVKGGRVVLISQSSNCSSGLNNVPVSIKQSSKTCEKASFKPETTTSSSLVGTFVISRSSCDVKWIIIGSVLGAVVILAVIAIAVSMSIYNAKSRSDARKALK